MVGALWLWRAQSVPMALFTTSGTPLRGTEKHMILVSPVQGLMLAAGSPSSLWYSCKVSLLSKTTLKKSCRFQCAAKMDASLSSMQLEL